ncbi:hypothetical protein HDV00_008776 [Rhizophlyctis rosea]|nr:hypothetical protein HDV00_008776 [Rhizophlyctis rosea]
MTSSPLHGEGLFAGKDFKEGDLVSSHLDILFGRSPPSWKGNSSAVLERPSTGIAYDDLKRLIITYNVCAARAANISVGEKGPGPQRYLKWKDAYCSLHWLVEYYIDDEPDLQTKLNFLRILQ